jgi:aspartate/methionine/tyrosine aminotransferase
LLLLALWGCGQGQGLVHKSTGRAADASILLSVGEPQNQPPAFLAEELARAAADWSRYPPPRGTLVYDAALTEAALTQLGEIL